MSDVTQEDLDTQAERLAEKRQAIRQAEQDRTVNAQQVDLEVTKDKLDAEERLLDAQLEEATRLADIKAMREGAPTVAERKAEMERELALKAAADEAKAAAKVQKAAETKTDHTKGE